MIVIVDYNIGNVGSIKNMLRSIGVDCVVSSDVATIKLAKKIILSGVGSFDNAMNNLADYNLIEVLNEKVLNEKVPVLGICLGMQIMAKESEEGNKKGLGWIDAKVVKFDAVNNNLRLPVIGWGYVKIENKNSIINKLNQRYYFVHSYYFPLETEYCVASLENGLKYCVAVQKGNIYGVQFHPEKSHVFGKNLLKMFCEL